MDSGALAKLAKKHAPEHRTEREYEQRQKRRKLFLKYTLAKLYGKHMRIVCGQYGRHSFNCLRCVVNSGLWPLLSATSKSHSFFKPLLHMGDILLCIADFFRMMRESDDPEYLEDQKKCFGWDRQEPGQNKRLKCNKSKAGKAVQRQNDSDDTSDEWERRALQAFDLAVHKRPPAKDKEG